MKDPYLGRKVSNLTAERYLIKTDEEYLIPTRREILKFDTNLIGRRFLILTVKILTVVRVVFKNIL